ncbi:hypothetical protein C7974DRAFT_410544 [Boeremia exigua]|uniref:uncharacterized protein n=1 Tax=Boeremia exigua TaxID=749465 RepID=UPI001E8D5DA3|nr:uncharacterized protein C7974DRAFT_410544 [Boeremia exigua]KAH6639584.1 hypothetical protein C7974DRAFT_410544 [Boeremia exigua]
MSNQQQHNVRPPHAQQGQRNDRPVQNPALSAQRLPPAHQPIPSVTWNPHQQVANDLQNWAGQTLVPFLRSRFTAIDQNTGRVYTSHNYDPDINRAIRWSEHIDAFDKHPNLMDELVLYLARPEQADKTMSSIAQDRRLITILLYRHYQRHGGLVLPPTADARQAIDYHASAIEIACQQGVQKRHLPRVVFPNWTFGTESVSTLGNFADLTARARGTPQGRSDSNVDTSGNVKGYRDVRSGGAGFVGEKKPSRFFGNLA